jgi:hypothetical protein
MRLSEDYLLFGAVDRAPYPDAPLQCPPNAAIKLRMAATQLLENGNHPDTRRRLEQGHDLLIEYRSQRVRSPPLALNLSLGWKPRVCLDAICCRRADTGLGGSHRNGMGMSELHVEPHLMIVDVAAGQADEPNRSFAGR